MIAAGSAAMFPNHVNAFYITGGGSSTRLRNDKRRWLMARILIGAHGQPQRFWNWPGAAAGDEGDAHMRLDQNILAALDQLQQDNRGALDLFGLGDHVEHII